MNALKLTTTPTPFWLMIDTVAFFADFYGISEEDVIQANRWFDPSIDDSIEEVFELIRDHNEISTTAAIDELLHV